MRLARAGKQGENSEFPCATEQGNYCAEQGIKSADQGIFRSYQADAQRRRACWVMRVGDLVSMVNYVNRSADRAETHDGKTFGTGGVLGRLLPFIAFNLVNYAAGLTQVGWLTFGWTTGIGILPFTVLMVVFGDRAEEMSLEVWLLAGAALMILLFCARVILRCRIQKKKSSRSQASRRK